MGYEITYKASNYEGDTKPGSISKETVCVKASQKSEDDAADGSSGGGRCVRPDFPLD